MSNVGTVLRMKKQGEEVQFRGRAKRRKQLNFPFLLVGYSQGIWEVRPT